MAVSSACYHEKQYIFNGTTDAVIPQMGAVLLMWCHYAKLRDYCRRTSTCVHAI